jgi:dTDP-4-amino-4,6-dideoxygalactose transaminase
MRCLKETWDSKWLNNNGKFHQQFEKELDEFLGVKFVFLFSNGTALTSALQVLRTTEEVITTPYTFVDKIQGFKLIRRSN